MLVFKLINTSKSPTRGRSVSPELSTYLKISELRETFLSQVLLWNSSERSAPHYATKMKTTLRNKMIEIALEWQEQFGVAHQITTPISEYDAAMLVGVSEKEYSKYMQNQTAVSKGSDFIYNNIRYQIKANRPSGKPGGKVTLVPKAKNYEWDILIWLLYDKYYVLQEAWQWDVEKYKEMFHEKKRLSPKDYRQGNNLI